MPRPKSVAPLWRDRVVDFRRIPARELQAHDGNWRVHPQFQQDALRGTLQEIGIAGALLVYHSPAQDGALVTIDGHLRKSLAPEQEWPCLILDVDDEEAAYILATHDPVTALATANAEMLRAVLDSVQSGEAGVQALLAQLAEQEGLIPPTAPDRPEDHWDGMPDFQQENQLGAAQVIVHFASLEDKEAFSQLVGQKMTPSTKFIWYPEREKQKTMLMESYDESA